MKKACFITLGCRLNQAETAIMAKGLEGIGYDVVQQERGVQLCVVNSCTVTNQSDQKTRQSIRALQKKNPSALVVVVGCFSQISAEEILEIGGVHLIIGNSEKLNLHRFVEQAEQSLEPLIIMEPFNKKSFEIETIGQKLMTTRANLKIQDGCDFRCSYCIIPAARGVARSRTLENMELEVDQLTKEGIKEIVLTGVNIGTYQYKETDFIKLLDRLNLKQDIQRIRISSIEPTTTGRELFSRMKDKQHKLTPYLHLPLQSPHDFILERMRRKYLYGEFHDFIRQALEEVPGVGMGTDIITGFPGESDSIFEESYQALEELGVHYFHVFPYAERTGTVSAEMDGQVPESSISKRALRLRELSDQKKLKFFDSTIGKSLDVLFEGNQGGNFWQGYSQNYIRVGVISESNLKNQILTVQIKSTDLNRVEGEITE